MMDAFVVQVEFVSSPAGTTVTLTQSFDRALRSVTADGGRDDSARSAVA